MVGIFAIFEKRELLGLDRVLRSGTSHDHEAMGLLPLVGFVSEFPDLPSVPKFFETTFSGPSFDRAVFFGYNHVTTTRTIEKLDDPLAKESRIGSNSDSRSRYVFGGFGQTDFEERNCSGTRGSISRA
jgi:hypothetical protein